MQESKGLLFHVSEEKGKRDAIQGGFEVLLMNWELKWIPFL